ncbi:MAG: DNA polymerase III, partial [Candidatus Aminicenantes bacterium]|nr:DNA polymerase III [Candidatus Aminicenantes bacterium]
ISRREGYDVDLDRVIDGASRHGKALELNSHYDRLDLDELHLKKAKQKGVRITMGTDTHYAEGMAMMRYGLGIARRAWLEPGDILNCLGADELLGKRAAKQGRRGRPS